jgi:hypothetical protein
MFAQSLISLFISLMTLFAPEQAAQTDGFRWNGTQLNRTTLPSQVVTMTAHNRSLDVEGGHLLLR